MRNKSSFINVVQKTPHISDNMEEEYHVQRL